MEEEGPMAIWRALVGENDNDEEDFQGFTVEEGSDARGARGNLAVGQIAVRQHFQ